MCQYSFRGPTVHIGFSSSVIHCAVCPQAASTNWLKNLPRLSGLPPDKVLKLGRLKQNRQTNSLARAVVPQVNLTNLTLFLGSHPRPSTFLIVRHPFDRLLSAYRDKLERYNTYYHKKYGAAIVSKWRREGRRRWGAAYDGAQGRQGRWRFMFYFYLIFFICASISSSYLVTEPHFQNGTDILNMNMNMNMKWKTGNGKREMGNGKRETGNGKR